MYLKFYKHNNFNIIVTHVLGECTVVKPDICSSEVELCESGICVPVARVQLLGA